MRLLRICLVLASGGAVALAQTNSTSITNAYEISATPAPGYGSTNVVRRLSLQDAIQLALKHNLDLQINRYNPEILLYNLRATYGDYDPTLSLSGQHEHNEQGVQLFGGVLSLPGSTIDSETFNSTLNGLLPWGMTYTLGTIQALQDTHSTTPTLVSDPTHPVSTSTNNIVDPVTGNVTGFLIKTNFLQVRGPDDQTANSVGQVGITVSQPLLKNFWIDQTRLNIRVAKNRLKYSEQTLRLQIMQTITTLEQAYFDLIYNRENVLVQQKAVELAERLVAENKKRLEVGTLAPLDLQSAEAQAASSRAAVIAAKSQLGTQERLVKQLITDKYLEWANISLEPAGTLTAPPPLFNLQDSWGQGLSERPDLLQAKLDVEKQGIQLKFDYNQLFPELDVFGSYAYNGSGTEFSSSLYNIQQMNRPTYIYGGRISMPLPDTRTRNNYRADKTTMQQLVLTLKKLEQTIMIAIDNDIGTLRANYDQVQATRAAREYEEAALDAEQKKLESGKSTTYTVLQVQRDLTTARGNEIQALDTYNKSLSQLSLDEGSTLRRLRINFEVK